MAFKHSFSLASRLTFDSALKSGYAVCACLAQLSIVFQPLNAACPCWVAPRLSGHKKDTAKTAKAKRFIGTFSPIMQLAIIHRLSPPGLLRFGKN